MAQTVSIRIWGDFACWTVPETKVERVSYPVPTPSGIRGVLESVFWEPQMYYLIDTIAIVKPGKRFTFRRNEVKTAISMAAVLKRMKSNQLLEPIMAGAGSGNVAQRNMEALVDVEYVVTAEVRLTAEAQPPRNNIPKYIEMIRRRATTGKCHQRPYLGFRELVADFEWVDDPAAVQADATFDADLGLMLYDVRDPYKRATRPATERHVEAAAVFFRPRIVAGRIDCHPDRVEVIGSSAPQLAPEIN